MIIPQKLNNLCYMVRGICMKVHKELGPGFPEEYYQKALEYEFPKNNVFAEPQKPIEVFYESICVGTSFLDFAIENILILEIKSTSDLNDIHRFQVIKYLASTNYPVVLLINFGESGLKYERILPPEKIQIRKNYDFSRFL